MCKSDSTYCLQHVNKTTTPIANTAIPPRLIDVIVIAVRRNNTLPLPLVIFLLKIDHSAIRQRIAALI